MDTDIYHLKLFCETNNSEILFNLSPIANDHINELVTDIINNELRISDRYFELYRYIKYKNILNEVFLRNILWRAKSLSYFNPEKNRKIDYEANNAFNRLVISYLTFINQNPYNPFFLINTENKNELVVLDKWVNEMKEKNIMYNPNGLIESINNTQTLNRNFIDSDIMTFEKQIPYIKDKINPLTYDRMVKKYINYNNIINNKNMEEHINYRIAMVFYRYTTYDSWSQCWTLTKKDYPSFKNVAYKNIELFGSPFNTQLDTHIFGTLFPDTDKYFGGIMKYQDLANYIIQENNNGEYFNIQISPPNLENILNTLPEIVRKLKVKNNIFVMFPNWTDNKGYREIEKMFDNKKIINSYLDMWTGKEVTISKSALFY